MGLLDNAPTAALPWGGYDFGKNSLAVIASGPFDGAVLWTVGAHVNMEIIECGIHELDDLGLVSPDDGIWIWEGNYSYHDEDAPELHGTFRRPTPEEWLAIQEARCPWDDLDWILPEHREAIAAERAEAEKEKQNHAAP